MLSQSLPLLLTLTLICLTNLSQQGDQKRKMQASVARARQLGRQFAGACPIVFDAFHKCWAGAHTKALMATGHVLLKKVVAMEDIAVVFEWHVSRKL